MSYTVVIEKSGKQKVEATDLELEDALDRLENLGPKERGVLLQQVVSFKRPREQTFCRHDQLVGLGGRAWICSKCGSREKQPV